MLKWSKELFDKVYELVITNLVVMGCISLAGFGYTLLFYLSFIIVLIRFYRYMMYCYSGFTKSKKEV